MRHITFIPIFLLLILILSACTTPQPTPNAAEVGLTLIANEVQAKATQAAVNNLFTATAQVAGATATQQSIIILATASQQARLDAQATAEQIRRDGVATEQQRRADAAATQQRKDGIATAEQARVDAISTQNADATSTFVVMTLTAIPPHATLTQMAVNNQIELSTQQVAEAGLKLKQQQDTNTLQWAVPMLIAVFAVSLLGLWVIRKSRTNAFADEDGRIQLIVQDHRHIIRPQLMPGPIVELDKEITMPQLVAPAEQSEVTKRAQAVDALAAMPVNPAPSAADGFNKYFGSQPEPRFGMLGDGTMPPAELLNEQTLKVIDGDWKENGDGQSEQS